MMYLILGILVGLFLIPTMVAWIGHMGASRLTSTYEGINLYDPAWPDTPLPTEEIAPGQIWCTSTVRQKAGDPFGPIKGPSPCNGTAVVVLDVKEGWVRYQIGEGRTYPDERTEEGFFRMNNDMRLK